MFSVRRLTCYYIIVLAVVSLSVLLLELTLTRIFSIILWYDYAFMAISIAFFGLGVGSLIAHMSKMRVPREKIPFLLLKSSLGFAVSIVGFLLLVSYIIPPSVDYLYLFYLASSLPFIFGGFTIALIFYSRPKDISRFYFYDLMGSAAATLLLDPLLRELGAESTLIFISLILSVTCLLSFSMLVGKKEYANTFGSKSSIVRKDIAILSPISSSVKRTTRVQMRVLGITLSLIIILSLVLTLNSSHKGLISVKPGLDKGLYFQLLNRSAFEHLYTEWNSFSRIDVTRLIHDPVQSQDLDLTGRSRSLAAVAIDADADTPVMRWNGTPSDLEWIKHYMDFLPYEIMKPNSTLVIGSGGGEDVLTALAGGSNKITAVEINPLIIEAAKRFGKSAGNLYEREEVDLVIDEGRRYLSGTTSEFDLIVIKLVDSWAAQLAGAYALSENYLYTIEAFKQYLEHLDENHGILVLIRWNIELPRLVPLIYESLREVNYEQEGDKELYNSSKEFITAEQDVLNKVIIVENKPGLYFLPTSEGSIYPVIVMIKNSGFTPSEIETAKQRVNQRESRAIVLPYEYAETPYGKILSGNLSSGEIGRLYNAAAFKLPAPTDDSPFFFARERIPSQLLTILATVLGLSGILIILLLYYSKLNRIDTVKAMSSSRHYLLFAAFIGFGFMFFEIILIQKFLLILGTPVLALTAILFSILISTGIGSYASGKIFRNRPDRAILISMPFLFALAITYYFVLDYAIYQGISLPVHERISLTLVFLVPIGFFMGFQFPSITRLASGEERSEHDTRQSLAYSTNITESAVSLGEEGNPDGHSVTLIWGVNIIASVIGSILAVISSMALGLNYTLLMGFGFYVAALGVLLLKLQRSRK